MASTNSPTFEQPAGGGLPEARIRSTSAHRHIMLARLIAGVPLLGIGLLHVVSPEAPMRPLVEAAGFPFPALLSPIAVGMEIVAGLSLLLGFWARVGGLLTVATMLGAMYAHLVIGLWPNPTEPPLMLPVAVMLCGAYVLRRGAGRWSLDRMRDSAER